MLMNPSTLVTTSNLVAELEKIAGLEFGGNIQDIGNKTKGKFYYDSVTKFYYECIADTNLTYNDVSKFRAISNKPISDKVENLFSFGKNTIKFSDGTILEHGTGTAGKSGTYVRNTLSKDFKSISAVVPVHRGSDTSNTNISIIASSNNTFDAYSYRPNESVSIYFIAIGRWK